MALDIRSGRDRPFPIGTPPCHPTHPTQDEGRSMDAFTAGLLQRIKATESDLSRARDEGDDFLVDVEQGELDDLRRLAAEHGVEVSAQGVC
ncbi:hypothetical protein SHKM778_23880 [Streptomyces sp. KM77-8]|uniref:Uncharacterized protein n=1 Tax=Streptomyces haneummycinicus TaxID=3074435 RepID=A0AAT9HFA4_9ACTN